MHALRQGTNEILRTSHDADKIAHCVLGLEKDRMPANVKKRPEVRRARPEKTPKRRARTRTLRGQTAV
jgi:hypothetical protein